MTPKSMACAVFLLALTLAPSAHGQVGVNAGLLNANLATADELGALPGLDAALVDAIVAARPLADIAELDALLGEGWSAEQRSDLYRKLWVPLDLNSAARESILLIPGVGARMAHEFEEYRPYAALAVFRREIGKYVDDAEVARLEQYVFVPLNLNTASEEDFMTIPGVGARMTHEFMEYRPYASMEQFRREIGKYVDDREVARLERYLTLD
jgi:DNA uptake protein ComE-like DNA-binding protein